MSRPHDTDRHSPPEVSAADVFPHVVGRADEMRTIATALSALRTGTGGFLQVVGEPGIGKTFLLAAVRETALAQGMQVLSGRATEFEQEMPFHILLDALYGYPDINRLRGLLPPAVAEALHSFMPDPDRLAGPGAATMPFSSAAVVRPELDIDRFRLFQTLHQLLTVMAQQPVVVLLDDVHWADPGSIDFIDFLSRRPIPGPVLIVVAHRDRQTPTQLRYTLARDTDRGAVTRIELGPFSPEEAAKLLGGRPGTRRIAELHEKSHGNPLYLLTLDRSHGRVRSLRDPAREDGDDTSSRLESLILGETLGLSAQEMAVAATAAVMGDPILPELVAAVMAGPSLADVEQVLNRLVGRDLMREAPSGPGLVFRHPLVRRVIYDRSAPTWRVEIHRKALALLTERGASAAERVRHIEHCAAAWAPEYETVLCQAGHDSMATSPLTAAHWYGVALSLLPAGEEFRQRRFEISYLAARALGLGGRFTESRDLLHEILNDASEPTVVNRSDAVVLCAHAEQRLGRYPEAIALLRAEIARLGVQTSPERVDLCLELGLTALLANDYPGARADISWALQAAREIGDRLGEATALAFSAFGEICVGHTAVARGAADLASELVDGMPDGAMAGERETLCMLGWAEMLLERFADADRHLARGRAIIRRTGQSHGLPHVLLGQCLVAMFTGRMTEALEHAEDAEDAARLVGSDHLVGIVLAIKAPIQVWTSPRGHGDAALAGARTAAELFTGSAVNSWWARNALMLRGHAELTNGDPATCVDLVFQAGGPDLMMLGAPLVPEYAEILISALIKLGQIDRAEDLADSAVALADSLDLPGQRAHAARARGLLSALRGDHRSADTEFALADSCFARAGRAVEQARTMVFHARTLVELGRGEQAVGALARSAEQAAARGAIWVRDELDRVRELIVGAHGPEPDRVADADRKYQRSDVCALRSGAVPASAPAPAARTGSTVLDASADRDRRMVVLPSQRSDQIAFSVLGPLEVTRGGAAVNLGPFKQRVILALLLCRANRVVPVSVLVDALWDAEPPRTARKSVQVHISELRKQLGIGSTARRNGDPVLEHTGPGYVLRVQAGQLDLLRFRDLVSAGLEVRREGDTLAEAEILGNALGVWRSPALADLAVAAVLAEEADRLHEMYVSAYEDWAEAELALGRSGAVLAGIEELVVRHPFRERLRHAQMLALHRAGRRTEALAAFDALRQRMGRDLGMAPSAVLERLHGAMLAGDPAIDAVEVR